MKHVVSAAAAGCLLAGTAFAGSSEQSLIDIENAWAKAYLKQDTGTIATYLADDWLAQSDSATRYTKSGFLADIKSGKLGYKAITLRDMKVRVFGNAGVVQGYDDEKSNYGKDDTSGVYSWVDVFVNRSGKWVAVASQVTKVK